MVRVIEGEGYLKEPQARVPLGVLFLWRPPSSRQEKGTPMALSRCVMVGEAFLRGKIGTVSPLRSSVPIASAQHRR